MLDQTTQTVGAKPYLRIRNLFKTFGSFTALRDINLDIPDKTFVCFLGPSGCGKTTLLRAIAGLDPQTSGTIIQDDRDISALPPSQRDFGIVFQSYALFPNLTVGENVGYGLNSRQLGGREAVKARVQELLELVGLPDSGPKFPAQLSGGQQQRVALARALATSPGLLLLDEPLSALDARVRLHLRQEMIKLQRRLGLTTIMVTHDQEEALTMADLIVVMNHGVIEQVGTPTEIYQNPASPFVANFVGSMNFLPAEGAGDGLLRVGEHKLQCKHSAELVKPGAMLTACIRPEDIAIRGIGGEADNSIAARIDRLEFMGSFYRARLAVMALSGATLIADFSPNDVRDLDLTEESDVAVALPDHHLRIFPGRVEVGQ